VLTERLIGALSEAADQTEDPEEKGRLRQIVGWLGGGAKDVLTGAVAAVISHQLGGT